MAGEFIISEKQQPFNSTVGLYFAVFLQWCDRRLTEAWSVFFRLYTIDIQLSVFADYEYYKFDVEMYEMENFLPSRRAVFGGTEWNWIEKDLFWCERREENKIKQGSLQLARGKRHTKRKTFWYCNCFETHIFA